MKYCPSCQTEYADDTLKFCLQDGTRLAAGAGEPPTAAFGEPETILRAQNAERIRFEIPDARTENAAAPVQTAETAYAAPETKKSNTALIVLATVFGTLLLFGIIGAGGWLYLGSKSEIAKNTNNVPNAVNAANQTSENDPNKNSNAKKSPTPKSNTNSSVSNTSPNANISATPLPAAAREQVVEEVSASLDDWKSFSESRDLNAHMATYADTIDYYKKTGASNSFVRNDKQRAFEKFDSISFNLSNMIITPDASGERATAVFDKEWEFSGADIASSGKVRQQLSLRKIGGKWLITAEKDIKIYYME